jgi:DNA-binding FrmR family transcriptional regulator
MKVMNRILAATGIAALLAVPAMAGEGADCKTMLDQVNAAMEKAALDDAAKKAVEDLKMKAEESMKAGDEAGCKATAGEALKALGVTQ